MVVLILLISENFFKEFFFLEGVKRFIIGIEFSVLLLFFFVVEEIRCDDYFEELEFDYDGKVYLFFLEFCVLVSFENFGWRGYF